MNIPTFLGDQQVVDEKGHFTEHWKGVFERLFSELQSQMSDESHITPSQPTSNITLLSNTKYIGGLLYDSDTKKLKVNLDGTFKEVATV
jgi:hypothetical protein